jgi:hypothetical protein
MPPHRKTKPRPKPVITWCGHVDYADGHCAELGCFNYTQKCRKHSLSGDPLAHCHQPILDSFRSVRIVQVAPIALRASCRCGLAGCIWRVVVNASWKREPPLVGSAAALELQKETDRRNART